MENWGIYVHIPWCRRRCPYCDFYFEIGAAQQGYAKKILEEFERKKHLWPAQAPSTLYLGGGTPSLLHPEELDKIIMGLKKAAGVQQWQVSLEANPEDLDETILESLKAVGVERLSLGIQSFDDGVLKWLGRAHDGKRAQEVIQQAQSAGFTELSVDFIFGLPGESLQRVETELNTLAAFDVGHASAYLLTVEPGTPLLIQIQKNKKQAPDDDFQADIYAHLQHELKRSGYQQYEISSWAKAGKASTHNRIYWGQGSYLGLGPGAHSCRVLPAGDLERRINVSDLQKWWQGEPGIEEVSLQSPEASFLESVAFGFRDMERGVRLKRLSERHQTPVSSELLSKLQSMQRKGWVSQMKTAWVLTESGALFADAVAREILN